MITRIKKHKQSFVIAIDFDGTIVDHEFPYIGELKPHAKEVINELYDEGHTIIIWTCRTSQHAIGIDKDSSPTIFHVKEFLESKGIKFDTINHNDPDSGFQPSPKVFAHIYIDDRQLGGIPDDWAEIRSILSSYHGIL